jgi:hypothetical protein
MIAIMKSNAITLAEIGIAQNASSPQKKSGFKKEKKICLIARTSM